MRSHTGEHFQCPQCQSIHVWGKGGAFCRMTCFYKYIGTNPNFEITKIIEESQHQAMERMTELNA